MSILNIHVSDREQIDSSPSANLLYRVAFRLGLLTAVVIAGINLTIIFITKGTALEWPHMFIFAVLFGCINWGMRSQRSWIDGEHDAQDRMAFGMISAGTAALGLMVINGGLALVSFNLVISETFAPINDLLTFAMSSMALFLGCIIFSLISSIMLNYHYGRKGELHVMPKDQSGFNDPLERQGQLKQI